MRNEGESSSVNDAYMADQSAVTAMQEQSSQADSKIGIDAEQNTEIRRLNRKVTGAWVAAISGPLIALGSLVFTGLQWMAAKDQLAVMRAQMDDARSGASQARRDTDRALRVAESQAKSLATVAESARKQIEVAQSQAAALQRQAESLASEAASVRIQAEASRSEAESMRAVADANRVMSDAASASARAAEKVAGTAARQLETTDRPWVEAALSAEDDLEFLFDNRRKQVVVRTTLRLTIHNTGRSVANTVRLSARPWIRNPKTPIAPGMLEKAAKELCATNEPTNEAAATLFPGGTTQMREISVTPLASADITSQTLQDWPLQIVEMFTIGCVTYAFSNSSDFHRTWFTYRLGKQLPFGSAAAEKWTFDVKETAPAGSLFVSRWPYGGNGAD